MHQLNLLFKVMSGVALVGWVLILAFPTWALTTQVVTYGVVGMLACLYVYILFIARPTGISRAKGDFFSLSGIVSLFQNPQAVLAGWVHFLAFDLMVALWIRADATSRAFGHMYMIPIYLLTLMFGPAGLLTYFLVLAVIGQAG
jgi:hypothetical protein